MRRLPARLARHGCHPRQIGVAEPQEAQLAREHRHERHQEKTLVPLAHRVVNDRAVVVEAADARAGERVVLRPQRADALRQEEVAGLGAGGSSFAFVCRMCSAGSGACRNGAARTEGA